MNPTSFTRRGFCEALGAATLSMAAPALSFGNPTALANPTAASRPNFLFILGDDLGVHQLGCYGSSFYETPNLDRLATQGMKFTHAYAAASICSPTRASIMTGKYPARVRVTDYIPGSDNWKNPKLIPPDWNKGLPTSETTIAEAIHEAGYVTGHFGKWHLNVDKKYKEDRPGDPASQGFDDVLTTVKPDSDADPTKDAHNVARITDRAIEFLEANKQRPFFCYVAHNSIHRPEMEHPELVAKYAKKAAADGVDNRAALGAMLEVLDSGVGRLLRKLDEAGLADNTIVVFFGDNGMFGVPDTLKPYRGAKGYLYEGGIREPLLVRWPGKIKANSICETPVISTDFFPTLMDFAGKPSRQPDLDGVSIRPLLEQSGTLSSRALYFHYPHYSPQGGRPSGAVIDGRHKLITWYEQEVDAADPLDAVELFDLREDIGEQHNLAKSKSEKARKLYEQFKQWQRSVGAQSMTLSPAYDPGKPTTSGGGVFRAGSRAEQLAAMVDQG